MTIVNNQINAFALTMRTLNQATTPPMTAAQREVVLRRWTEFLRNEANRPGGPVLDEKLWREWLDRFTVPPAPAGELPPNPPPAN